LNGSINESFNSSRKFSSHDISYAQSGVTTAAMEVIKKRRERNAAFESWRKKLSSKDTLPRGKYFKGKIGAITEHVSFDEFYLSI